jgi:hypothetical protein
MMRDPRFHLSKETVEQIESALEAEAQFVISQRNEQAAGWLANFFGATRTPANHTLLWKLVDARLAAEQSLICITWYRDTSDLPRIVAAIVKPAGYSDPADPHGYEHFGTVGQLQAYYGRAARPYLRDLLNSSKQTWIRAEAAKSLVEMNDRSGWRFFIEVINQRPSYKDQMVRWLGDHFSTVRNKDDAELLSFLEAKLSTASDGN